MLFLAFLSAVALVAGCDASAPRTNDEPQAPQTPRTPEESPEAAPDEDAGGALETPASGQEQNAMEKPQASPTPAPADPAPPQQSDASPAAALADIGGTNGPPTAENLRIATTPEPVLEPVELSQDPPGGALPAPVTDVVAEEMNEPGTPDTATEVTAMKAVEPLPSSVAALPEQTTDVRQPDAAQREAVAPATVPAHRDDREQKGAEEIGTPQGETDVTRALAQPTGLTVRAPKQEQNVMAWPAWQSPRLGVRALYFLPVSDADDQPENGVGGSLYVRLPTDMPRLRYEAGFSLARVESESGLQQSNVMRGHLHALWVFNPRAAVRINALLGASYLAEQTDDPDLDPLLSSGMTADVGAVLDIGRADLQAYYSFLLDSDAAEGAVFAGLSVGF
jgi:hypothetical protein